MGNCHTSLSSIRVQCLSDLAKLKQQQGGVSGVPAGATAGQMAALAAANANRLSSAKSQEELDQETEKLLQVHTPLFAIKDSKE